ncbi:hypothetical protein V5O48_004483 [Marasmius crinis-equi]|uniref:Uncharacterized protein n=1 Tax=Marasmius crinis-equi TaxID=585013 RepID=A0ABR3FPX5_9AGAR
MVALNVQDKQIDCRALMLFIETMGSLSVGLACVNLAIRTIAVWRNDRRIVIGLIVVILGHWAILLRDIVIIRSQWVDGQGCIVTNNQPQQLFTAVYIYAMGIDFIVMCLMGYKTGIQLHKRSPLIKILILDGFLYFIIA